MSFPNDGFEKYPKVYVSLDSLLDFRFGSLRCLDEAYAMESLITPDYRHRKEDVFKVDMLRYKEMVKNPTIDNLVLSPVTNIYHAIREVLANLAKSRYLIDHHDGLSIDLNIYPFYYTEKDTEDDLKYYLPPSHLAMLREDFKRLLGNTVSVNFIRKHLNDLTPNFLMHQYSYIFMYDYNSWFVKHVMELTKTPMLKTVVYGPRLFFNERTVFDPAFDELSNQGLEDPFKLTEEFVAPAVNLQLMDVIYYSVLDPDIRGLMNLA